MSNITSGLDPRRVGSFTASRAADLMTNDKSGRPGATCMSYISEVATERYTGLSAEREFTSAATEHGHRHEADAIAIYSLIHNVVVEPAKYRPHPRVRSAGATPDGFVGADGLVQAKCPVVALKHLASLRQMRGGGVVPADMRKYCMTVEYAWQHQFELWCCPERSWLDAISFSPKFPAASRLATIRVHRDPKKIAEIEARVAFAERAVEQLLDELDAGFPPAITEPANLEE